MAPVPSRIGEFRVHVDGSWDIDDLLNLSESFAESYGFFYALVVTDEEVARQLHTLIQRQFWSGERQSSRFGKFLYNRIPSSDGLKIRSFEYHSPGTLTLLGVLSALLLTAKVVKAWVDSGSALLTLWGRVDKYFEKRKRFVRPKRQTALDQDAAEGLDEARELVFEVAALIGIDRSNCERVIGIAGNPVSALKLLVAVSKEARKLAEMQAEGLLRLPPLPDQPVSIAPSSALPEPPRVLVVRKPRRKKIPPPSVR